MRQEEEEEKKIMKVLDIRTNTVSFIYFGVQKVVEFVRK
jgi:hypothetical protein